MEASAPSLAILIADDHQLMREAVIQLLARAIPTASFCQACYFAEVLAHLSHANVFNLVLLDLKMPGMQGLASVAQVVQACAPAPVLVWTGVESPDLERSLQAIGVAGVVSKGAHSSDLLQAVLALTLHSTAFEQTSTQGKLPAQPLIHNHRVHKEALTDRQLDLLRLLHEGKPNKLIARELGIALGTVKNHLHEVFVRLRVNGRTELLAHTKEWFL